MDGTTVFTCDHCSIVALTYDCLIAGHSIRLCDYCAMNMPIEEFRAYADLAKRLSNVW